MRSAVVQLALPGLAAAFPEPLGTAHSVPVQAEAAMTAEVAVCDVNYGSHVWPSEDHLHSSLAQLVSPKSWTSYAVDQQTVPMPVPSTDAQAVSERQLVPDMDTGKCPKACTLCSKIQCYSARSATPFPATLGLVTLLTSGNSQKSCMARHRLHKNHKCVSACGVAGVYGSMDCMRIWFGQSMDVVSPPADFAVHSSAVSEVDEGLQVDQAADEVASNLSADGTIPSVKLGAKDESIPCQARCLKCAEMDCQSQREVTLAYQ
jgi:hypothetical protein